jgi:EAL domain-containing protein (putative c-di-GMP-specific phosphodiesterase class I)/DNA-binding NarL/FixJ family response regulator
VSTSTLIVDDDPLMRGLLEHMLRQLGHAHVVALESGVAALAHVLAHPNSIGVIFLDLNMPDMDGVEFIRKLAHHKFKGGIALVSGVEDRLLEAVTQLIRSLRLHPLGCLRKPVQAEQLRALLAALVAPSNATSIRTDYRYPWTAAELSVAVNEKQLFLQYQPLVWLATGEVLGVEGLVRWLHPVHGLIPPDLFIPIAEETGVIREITRFVLAEGMRQSRTWSEAGCPLNVALNVSIGDLGALDFPDLAASLATRAGVDPDMITFEVSEHQIIRHLGTALDVLSRLKLKRFRLAMDDFGTGYSSLSQLRDLPFDELKIDRGFVRRSPTTAKLRTICAASIRMAHELKMLVVAEGVENDAEWSLMQQLGAEVGQGFGIARPMAAELIPRWRAVRPAGRRRLGP